MQAVMPLPKVAPPEEPAQHQFALLSSRDPHPTLAAAPVKLRNQAAAFEIQSTPQSSESATGWMFALQGAYCVPAKRD